MRTYQYSVAVVLSAMLAVKPATACLEFADLELDDIKYASVVVIGKITDYEIVPDRAARLERWLTLARFDLPWEYRKSGLEQKHFMSDYARFKVIVDEVLVGKPPKIITTTWDNSTFGEPETMKAGPYLIGLREPGSKIPPLRGPTATILPSPEPNSMTVLQAPCAPAFILEASSAEAKTIRAMLSRQKR